MPKYIINMVKRAITPFIYVGMLEYMLRVPHSAPPGGKRGAYVPDGFALEYYRKKDFSLQFVLDRRLELVREFEKNGKRLPPTKGRGKGRWISSQFLEEQEAVGAYDDLKRKHQY